MNEGFKECLEFIGAILGILFITIVVAIFLIAISNRIFNNNSQNRFVTIDYGINYEIVYDKETKVEYTVKNGMYTVLVDAEGQPLLYKGE